MDRFRLVPQDLPLAANLIQVLPLDGGEAEPGSPVRRHLRAILIAKVARLMLLPAHNEEANRQGSWPRRSRRCRASPAFEIVVVNDGSKDATGRIADELAAANTDVVRAIHHPTNLGYGAALRSGFRASRFEHVAFTDGDRQFHVVDVGRLLDRLAAGDAPDIVVGFRIKRADPLVRTVYARLYRLANRIFFGLRVEDRLRLQASGARPSGNRGRVGRRVLLGRAADQAPGGGSGVAEVGAALPANRGSRPARSHGRVPGRPRLLAAAPADTNRPGDPPRRASWPRRPAPRSGPRRPAALGSTSSSSRIPEDVEPGVDDPLAGRLEASSPPPRRRHLSPPSAACSRTASLAKIRPPVRTARARASDGRESISNVSPLRSRCSRAWYVSSARVEITTRSTRTPRLSRALAKRSWVSGRSAVRPWSFIAIALASHGPIQIGR